MAFSSRIKRVTDPLDDRVKDRIVGRDRRSPEYVSSGSEHSGGDDDDLSISHCLSDLLQCSGEEGGGCGAAEDDEGRQMNGKVSDPLSDLDCDCDFDLDSGSDRTDAVVETVISVMRNQSDDRFRNVLMANVLNSVEVCHSLRPNQQILNRNVMAFLQNIGYNAAICKTKWESCGGLTAGNYEFIDVVEFRSGTRYFIDLNFAGQFEIARQTNQFRRLASNLPAVFVGKNEDLKQIVKLMSDAARRSLKSRGLLLPPWRKNRFMQNKWFGPYRRTVNHTPANFSSASSIPARSTPSAVECRSIGFNAVSNVPLLPAATRTR